MPNYCGNKLGVAGPYAEVRQFIKDARGRPFTDSTSEPEEEQAICFHKLYPVSSSDDADYLQKWGTKWDAEPYGSSWTITDSNTVVWDPSDNWHTDDAEDCCATIRFDTAWSPPLALFDKVAADYPKLTFRLRYLELGNGLYGVAEWRNGAQVRNDKMNWETIDVVDWIGPETSLDDDGDEGDDDGDEGDDDGPVIADDDQGNDGEKVPADKPSP